MFLFQLLFLLIPNQITQVAFARHNRFRYIKLNFKYARASEAIERSEASGVREIRKFSHFHILKLLFP